MREVASKLMTAVTGSRHLTGLHIAVSAVMVLAFFPWLAEVVGRPPSEEVLAHLSQAIKVVETLATIVLSMSLLRHAGEGYASNKQPDVTINRE